MTIEQLASEVSKNAKGEYEAIEIYLLLLHDLKQNHAPQELINQVKEIISDEMQHGLVLAQAISWLTNIQPNKD